MSARIPCMNPRCRRTAPREKYPDATEVICRRCWRALPAALRERLKLCRRTYQRMRRLAERRVARGEITTEDAAGYGQVSYRALWRAWNEVRARLAAPDGSADLAEQLAELGLLDKGRTS